jgi:hypothetical protein
MSEDRKAGKREQHLDAQRVWDNDNERLIRDEKARDDPAPSEDPDESEESEDRDSG